MDAREIESLSMISRGFEELRDVNPELAYNVILDILSGINEYVSSLPHLPAALVLTAPCQQPRRAQPHPDRALAVPAQAHHPPERDDREGPRRDRGGGDLRAPVDGVAAAGPGAARLWLARAQVAHLGAAVFALAGGPQAQVAEYTLRSSDCVR